jgi:branched-chain amino acid aminotransferase
MDISIIKSTNLKQKPQQNQLGFGRHFTDHIFVMQYNDGKGWHSPTIKPYAPLELDPAAMVLHYGQAVFEGMKCYRTNNNKLLLFRPLDNFKRLNVSDARMCIPAIDENFALKALIELIKLDQDWVPSEPGTSLYIRPFTIATESCVGVRPALQYHFIIILSPVGPYNPEGFKPIKIFIEDEYVRAVRGGVGFAKASANYAISLKSQVKAHEQGYSQVLWLDGVERKYIEEVGAMNVFFYIGDELITPSLEGSILPGITRNSVIQLAQKEGIKVTERKLSIQELYETHEKGILKEAFGSGTAVVIAPIGEFNWQGKIFKVGDGNVGPIANKLYDKLTGIQYGRYTDEFNWVKNVLQ